MVTAAAGTSETPGGMPSGTPAADGRALDEARPRSPTRPRSRLSLGASVANGSGGGEPRAPLIRQAFELYASGEYPLDRLQATMADQGLTTRATTRWPSRPISTNQLHKMLRDRTTAV